MAERFLANLLPSGLQSGSRRNGEPDDASTRNDPSQEAAPDWRPSLGASVEVGVARS